MLPEAIPDLVELPEAEGVLDVVRRDTFRRLAERYARGKHLRQQLINAS